MNMDKILCVYFGCVLVLIGCAHQPEVPPEMTIEDRVAACQKARHDESIFCHESDIGFAVREKKCWDAFRNIRKYCDE